MQPIRDPSQRPEWHELRELASTIPPLRQLVVERSLYAECRPIGIDYTRQRVDAQVLNALFRLSDAVGLPDIRESMFAGEEVNPTEQRKVLHVALRGTADDSDAQELASRELDRMSDFAEGVRSGAIRGSTGEPFHTVVNIGIGGSDLGPRMVYEALAPFRDPSIDVRFVSNVDPSDFEEAFDGLDPTRTLVIVASKTFTTAETMSNARRAREWLTSSLGDDSLRIHMVAVSTATGAVNDFGLTEQFRFWDWVGGRYSIGSAIGLSAMIAIGPMNFRAFLRGLAGIDHNFRTAPHRANLPLILGLLAVWNRTFLDIPTLAILPYSHRLRSFPDYLQQLIMESNGKSVRRDGSDIHYSTSPIVWGAAGTVGQHSFHQLIHQGSSRVACDVIIVRDGSEPTQQRALVANALAQADVFAVGHAGEGDLASHRRINGDNPTTLIATQRLDPESLGALIALYEHSVLTQGILWGINPFDQFGVEVGKGLANQIEQSLLTGDESALAPLTQHTLSFLRNLDNGY